MQFFYLGETWTFDFEMNNALGGDIDIGSSTIDLRISSLTGSTLISNQDVAVIDAVTGKARARVEPNQQSGFFAPAYYIVQAKLTLPSGEVSVQARDMFALRKAD